MIYCDKVEYKKFDEAEFLIQCMRNFEDIRRMYNLNEEILKRAQEVTWLRKAAELVIEGCTEQGILEMEKNKLPEWEKEREGVFQICLNSGNTSWCQNYLNCCSNKKKHTFTPNVL